MRKVQCQQRGVALIIVLAFVVLLAGLTVAYFSQTTTDRQIAHTSFSEANADQIASSAVAIIVGDLRQEIIRGSSSPAPSFGPSPTASPYYLYTPISSNYMVPQRSGTPSSGAPIPNLVRRSVRTDSIATPGLPSRASAVNSATDPSANGRTVTLPRWNKHYLIPKLNTGDDQTDPVTSFVAPDWVMLTGEEGAAILSTPRTDSNGNAVTAIGRYAYAVYDESGLLDLNVAGYPTGTTAIQSGRKGSSAFADLTALGSYPLPTSSPNQVDRLVGWRNYATTQASNIFPNSNFASNLSSSTAATNFYNIVVNNTSGFLKVRGDPAVSPSPWPNPSPSPYPWNNRTDQMFLNRQQLLEYRKTAGFSSNALQFLGTFSRESNSPSFSPSTPTAINPNFSLIRVTTSFTRFDGTTANVGEPLVKTRFPLSRLAWVTYKGPSATLQICKDVDGTINTNCTSDSVIVALVNSGVPISTLRAGTAANIKNCFGLVWDSRSYVPASGTTPSSGQQWVYTSPSSNNGGGTFTGTSGGPASAIKRLDTVASENREPDFFELLRATVLDGSLGQNTGGGVTGAPSPGPSVFPDLHMSNKDHHILSVGAAIIDQADPDSIPTRIQFKPGTAATWWTAYGVESLPYITQIYPVSGTDPNDPTSWATYLLFQLWNPHQNIPTRPAIRLRVDGGLGLFAGGNGQIWNSATGTFFNATGQSVTLNSTATFAPSPAPLQTTNCATTGTAAGTFAALPNPPASGATPFVGFRLPDARTSPTPSPTPTASPRLILQFGASSPSASPATARPFNATMEVDVGGGVFVPYNHFEGISDNASWIDNAPVGVRDANSTGTPRAFTTVQLSQTPPPSLMKADPRATRFGIVQISTATSQITQSLWPSSQTNGYGGAIADGTPANPGAPVEHAPLRFSAPTPTPTVSPAPPPTPTPTPCYYFPATLCINSGGDATTRTTYSDNDGIVRPADSVYPDPSVSTPGSSTPYYTTSLDYHPLILNRPFRNVAELSYAFRDLPWKSLDFFTDKSADAGLLDVFSINDGPGSIAANGSFIAMGPLPTMTAGQINLNTNQTAVLQSILAGAIWDELDSTNSVSKIGAITTAAPVIASNIVTATSTIPLVNRSQLVTQSNLPLTILPLPAGGTHNQSVKVRRETVPRAISSLSQTRTWNLMIDVIAQSGTYPPGETNLANFVVQGEQRYWVHVAIDRFTGQVIDKQIEVVNE
jgi:hypothetical protein